VSARDIRAQVDRALEAVPRRKLAAVERVSVFNSGSVLDQRTLPTSALWHLFDRLSKLPNLKLVSLDTRAEFVEGWELDGLLRRLGRIGLEVAVGYETQNERIRNRVLRKGLSERTFRDLCAMLASKGVRLKAYVMVKPDPSMTEREGVEEAVRTLRRIAALRRRSGLAVCAHLNPTYVAKGSKLEREFRSKHYSPPRLWSVVDIILRMAGAGLSIQVGLDTEGLAVRGGTFRNCGLCDARVRKALEAFSGSQDFRLLRALSCPCRRPPLTDLGNRGYPKLERKM
jgi:radical SAM enzyme (TIGR01210 family)